MDGDGGGFLRGEAGELGKDRDAALVSVCFVALFSGSTLGRRGHASSQQLEKRPPRAVSNILRPFCDSGKTRGEKTRTNQSVREAAFARHCCIP